MSSQFRTNLTRTALGAAGAAALGIGYASGIERNAFALREVTMPVLAPGSSSLRVLHLSDLHMMPNQRLKQNWLRELEGLDPDLVVNTGDNLSHQRSVPAVVQALGDLLARPGLFVFGSNDYFAPKPKNPLSYIFNKDKRITGDPSPGAICGPRSPNVDGWT
ncbi:metallophosphoesterase [Rhodococcus erythropolis]|uniref:Metallophosphoesterase n=1 Tax=Rhodococcus erythropolis TaxID=1833 RepID=A0A6G9CL45_RHOER|nr:metallophosphoesterase [Rhodococcus erythropolis]